jgi:flagellar basal-body rod modification protein FlgD
MTENDFLNLLVKQLQYQNPLDPTNATDFASQLAQYASVEQLENIDTLLTSSLTEQESLVGSLNNALATNFIGKSVCAEASSFEYTGSGSLKIGYDLESTASSVSVNVCDSSGTVIKTISGKTATTGNTVTWDGTETDGTTAPSGSYTFTVNAVDSSDSSITATSYIYGNVTAVRYKSTGTVFVIDGVEVSLSDVTSISEAE